MNFNAKGYLKETCRPIYSAALVLPFLCIYHIGTMLFHTTYINGADALIIRILSSLSVHSMFASALVLAACFTIWQLRTRASWKIRMGVLLVSLLESICFAMILLFAFGWMTTHLSLSVGNRGSAAVRLILYCGAGIYEELVFRAFLVGILVAAFSRIFHMKKGWAAVVAVFIGALLFSAFHYIGPAGDTFSFGSFIQRMIGGLYFSVLYVTRGFGVTAASHAIYDILVGVILA
jgi:membrane protease YdiL (CAAX protease family)